MYRPSVTIAVAAVVLTFAGRGSSAGANPALDASLERALDRLVAAYPDALERIDGGDLVWRDGTRMKIDDGLGPKRTETDLDHASILDMVRDPYPAGSALTPPASGAEPGRARNQAFFVKLYGDCEKGGVAANLGDVPWLPGHGGTVLKFNARHGAATHLSAVSARLDKLPLQFVPYLMPPAGSYNCRAIAGSGRRSAHGYGIAVDIALKHAHYWRWSKPEPGGGLAYHNEIPPEIVAAFEAEGFIWGGRWSHYDTMHFEYRPELVPAGSPPPKP